MGFILAKITQKVTASRNELSAQNIIEEKHMVGIAFFRTHIVN